MLFDTSYISSSESGGGANGESRLLEISHAQLRIGRLFSPISGVAGNTGVLEGVAAWG